MFYKYNHIYWTLTLESAQKTINDYSNIMKVLWWFSKNTRMYMYLISDLTAEICIQLSNFTDKAYGGLQTQLQTEK